MRPNLNPTLGHHPRTFLSVDFGINPIATAVCWNGHVFVASSGLNGYLRRLKDGEAPVKDR